MPGNAVRLRSVQRCCRPSTCLRSIRPDERRTAVLHRCVVKACEEIRFLRREGRLPATHYCDEHVDRYTPRSHGTSTLLGRRVHTLLCSSRYRHHVLPIYHAHLIRKSGTVTVAPPQNHQWGEEESSPRRAACPATTTFLHLATRAKKEEGAKRRRPPYGRTSGG